MAVEPPEPDPALALPQPPVLSHDIPAPEYEEIQELRETRGCDTAGEHALRGEYEFTKCPAYVTTSAV